MVQEGKEICQSLRLEVTGCDTKSRNRQTRQDDDESEHGRETLLYRNHTPDRQALGSRALFFPDSLPACVSASYYFWERAALLHVSDCSNYCAGVCV